MVAVAAYIRVASRSQPQFQNNEIESHSGVRAHPHLRRARYPPVVHFNSRLASVRMWIWHSLSQWPFPGSIEARKRNEVSWWLLTSLVSQSQEWAFFPRPIWHKTSFIPTCVGSRSLPVNKARWRMCTVLLTAGLRIMARVVFTVWRARQDDDSAGKRSSSSQVTLDLEDDGSTRQQQDLEAATSSKTSKSMDDRPSRFHVKKSSKTDSASVSVVDRSSRFNGPSGTKGSDHHSSHSVECGRRDRHRGSERCTQGASKSKATEADSAGLPSRSVTRSRRQFHPACLWWEDPGPTAAQCLPGPRDLNAIDHAVVNGVAEIEVTGLRDVTTRQGSITRLGIERVGSGPGPCFHREGPAPGPSRLTRTDVPGSGRALGRATDVRPSTSTHYHHGRRESVDKEKSESSYMSRRDVQLSPVIPQAPEKRTITVIPSPPRPAGMDNSAGVTGPTDSAKLPNSAGVTGPADSPDDQDSADDESAGVSRLGSGWRALGCGRLGRCCRPRQMKKTRQVWPTQQIDRTRQLTTQQGVTGLLSRVPQQGLLWLQLSHQTGKDKTLPCSRMPAVWFPRPFKDRSTALLEFISMMTLMQRRMDITMTVPYTQSMPVAQTPTSRDYQTPPRRSRTPVRRSRTPVRRSRTPVRRSKGMDESRDSTRSRSPIRR